MGIPGIILAAGPGTRFLGPKYKLLMSFRGKTIIYWVVKNALDSELESVWVVIGHEKEMMVKALFPLASSRRLHIVENPNFLEGRASTLRCGFEAVPKPIDYAMFLLGDQPLVTTELINELIDAVQRNPSVPIFFPLKTRPQPTPPKRLRRLDGSEDATKGWEKGNPIVYSKELFDELIAIEGDKSGFEVVEKYYDRVFKLPLNPPKADKSQLNVNTYEDYLRLLKYERK